MGATVAATGAASGKAAGALLPFTGVAFALWIVIAVGLITVGFVLRKAAARRS